MEGVGLGCGGVVVVGRDGCDLFGSCTLAVEDSMVLLEDLLWLRLGSSKSGST